MTAAKNAIDEKSTIWDIDQYAKAVPWLIRDRRPGPR